MKIVENIGRTLAVALASAVLVPAAAAASAVVVVAPGGPVSVRRDPALPPDPGLAAPLGACRPRGPAPRATGAATAVLGALAHARRAQAISEAQRAAYEAVYRHARTVAGRLAGRPRAELSAVVASADALARRGALTVARMPSVFLELERNAQFWPRGRLPVAPQPQPGHAPCAGRAGLGGARVTFAGDPAVFQWYPGEGLRLQPLAAFGRAGGLETACEPGAPPEAGARHPGQIAALLDRLVALSSRRHGYVAWEYLFAFGGGAPPWVSGLAQGTAIQALARGAAILRRPDLLAVAHRALGAFTLVPPAGVRVAAGVGVHYLIYSFAPGVRVLNGFLQALVGLHDLGATGDAEAERLFAQGDREARREVPAFDTGAWSRYAAGGAESDLGYHRLVRDFLRALCARTSATVYCATADRFTRYLHEPARLSVLSVAPLRAGRTALVRLALSKVSCVTLTLRRGGRIAGSAGAVLGGGRPALAVTPRAAGAYELEVAALDLAGHRTVVRRTLAVRRRGRG